MCIDNVWVRVGVRVSARVRVRIRVMVTVMVSVRVRIRIRIRVRVSVIYTSIFSGDNLSHVLQSTSLFCKQIRQERMYAHKRLVVCIDMNK